MQELRHQDGECLAQRHGSKTKPLKLVPGLSADHLVILECQIRRWISTTNEREHLKEPPLRQREREQEREREAQRAQELEREKGREGGREGGRDPEGERDGGRERERTRGSALLKKSDHSSGSQTACLAQGFCRMPKSWLKCLTDSEPGSLCLPHTEMPSCLKTARLAEHGACEL